MSRLSTVRHRYGLLWLSLEDARKSPTRKTLGGLGLLLVLAAIVGGGVKGAGIEVQAVPSVARQGLLGAVGVVLLIGVMLAPRVNAPAAAVLQDADFWNLVFDVLPPAFIKEYPEPKNVRANATLDAFQGDFRRASAEQDKGPALIAADHKRGDADAANSGESLQVELCDVSGVRVPKKILTYKKRVEYAGRIFIIGWCLPVEFQNVGPRDGEEQISVKELGGQSVFSLLPVVDEDHSLTVRLGDSVRRQRLAERQPIDTQARVVPGN